MSEIGFDARALLDEARRARERAYAPYSRFRVGAALLGASGRIHPGCNVENVSYGLTVCAERVALQAAVAAGERAFLAVAIVAGESDEGAAPCGACRQVLYEFAPDLPVILPGGAAGGAAAPSIVPLSALLPRGFGPADLRRGADLPEETP